MPILNEIIDWVENKPVFWQVAIDRLIRNNELRNNELTDNDVSELKEICKADYGLSGFYFDDLRNFANSSTNSDDIILSKISNVDNINALSKTSYLEFESKGLTLVCGDNGSGKSSYVSILKHVCNTRGHKPTTTSIDLTLLEMTRKLTLNIQLTGLASQPSIL